MSISLHQWRHCKPCSEPSPPLSLLIYRCVAVKISLYIHISKKANSVQDVEILILQAVFIQNSLKLWAAHCLGQEEVEGELVQRLELLVGSEALEVQERSSTGLHLLRYVAKQREKGEEESVKAELETFFAGELNPVAPKAQRKVPVPEGLDLDAWINEPEEEEEDEDSEDDMKSLGGQVKNYVSMAVALSQSTLACSFCDVVIRGLYSSLFKEKPH